MTGPKTSVKMLTLSQNRQSCTLHPVYQQRLPSETGEHLGCRTEVSPKSSMPSSTTELLRRPCIAEIEAT